MKLKAKEKKDGKWGDISISSLKGQSLIDYCNDSFDPVTIAMYKDVTKVPDLIVTNKEAEYESYENRNKDNEEDGKLDQMIKLIIHSDDLSLLLNSHIVPHLVLNTFEGSTFFELNILEPDKEE